MTPGAGRVLREALGADVDRLLSAEPDVREDVPDSVHRMRVATRRLRSVLRSYRPLLRRAPIRELRDELRWLGGLLGVARDAEVRAERFEALAARHSGAPHHAGRRLAAAQRQHYAQAHRAVVIALDDARYARLREQLSRLRDDPPLRDDPTLGTGTGPGIETTPDSDTEKIPERAPADPAAAPLFSQILRDDVDRVARLVREEPAPGDPDRIEHLHRIRKAAKRLRYCADAAAPVLGKSAEELSGRAKKVQSILGDHRDAVEALDTIRTRTGGDHGASDDHAAYDPLCAAESDAARRALDRYPDAATFFRSDHPR